MNGISLAASAAGAVVALVGKNEDGSSGKTLSRESVIAVMNHVAMCFERETFAAERPMAY
eukprot:COSAG02_NODE_73031_length_177_cov_88.128205_1_plen_59_part_11